jgi:hypothetical protein
MLFGEVEGRRPETRRVDRVAGAKGDGRLFLVALPGEIRRASAAALATSFGVAVAPPTFEFA